MAGAAGGGAGDGSSTAGGVAIAGPSWNQLWRHFAQRTVRPSTPIALSGTT
jgi:hypothetical protein